MADIQGTPRSTLRTQAQRLGDAAEDAVADQLTAAGLSVLGRNLRFGRNEVDLLAIDPGPPATLVSAGWSRHRPCPTARGCLTCRSGSTSQWSSRAKGWACPGSVTTGMRSRTEGSLLRVDLSTPADEAPFVPTIGASGGVDQGDRAGQTEGVPRVWRRSLHMLGGCTQNIKRAVSAMKLGRTSRFAVVWQGGWSIPSRTERGQA